MTTQNRTGAPWQLEFGATVVSGGSVRFRVWAPLAGTIDVKITAPSPGTTRLVKSNNDVFEGTVDHVRPGTDYVYVIDGTTERPDPVSRWQPHGVHGPSRVVDPKAFTWTDENWRGLSLEDYVFYELHVGTFTDEGTFDGVIRKLPHLRGLGVTAIEIMPIAECPGSRNWGYDGVDFYAPQSTYGGPEGLRRLVDACHGKGLAVVVDVVYNHIGPEGNYLTAYAPFLSGKYRTPWGDALNYDDADSDGVRRFIVENALYWITEFHCDALRLDAIHGIFDSSAKHLLQELTEDVHAQAKALGRPCFVIAESDLNDVRVINPVSAGGYAVDAQWSDDFHHALHVLLTENRQGYLSDFGRMDDLRKALAEGFVYDGCRSAHRRRRHGSSSRERPGQQFVVFNQNHDQIANGSGGNRLSTLISFERQKLAAAVLLCAPNLPMLFMGQEYGETAPFLFFTSHSDPELAEAVRRGRAEEFATFTWNRECADPQDERTFLQSKLDWALTQRPQHSALLTLHRDLLQLRRDSSCLRCCRKDLTGVDASESELWLSIERRDANGSSALCLCNFADRAVPAPVAVRDRRLRLAIWTGDTRYGTEAGTTPPLQVLDDSVKHVVLPPETAAIYTTLSG
jgi:maltooligosyltrehalose trehalohydrolase